MASRSQWSETSIEEGCSVEGCQPGQQCHGGRLGWQLVRARDWIVVPPAEEQRLGRNPELEAGIGGAWCEE